ncbi:hypothetical protein [Microbacterium album]|uniref:Peptidoglycan binding-like domain-containing protein n=1 Tax=Microbacterium album TaxID=2053191 RepID=A0A917IG19_9MICO|nr:hypothetical protein [Microbacterium album]GGH46066.1 hypothetical protein GCM10010921_21900 [Microbacterium album]
MIGRRRGADDARAAGAPAESGSAGAQPADGAFDELVADPGADTATAVLATPDEDAGDAAADASAAGSTARVAGWARVFRGNRTLWIVAGVAVVSLVAGLALGRFAVAPAEASDDAPAPGLVTVPVEYGRLSNDVTIRGEIGYVDATQLTLDTSSIAGAAVVTGQVPSPGDVLDTLSVALEIAGRPVIVLPGELPAYRDLRLGASGPDVLQLKQSLAEVGLSPGDVTSDVFDQATADALGRLYSEVGYTPPSAGEGAADAVRAAEDGVRSAEEGVAAARRDLEEAGKGPSPVEVKEYDNAVAAAARALAEAQASGDVVMIGNLRDELDLARLRRSQLDAPRDVAPQRAALAAAEEHLTAAREALAAARAEVQPFLPAGEVLYLMELPRRVDEVSVSRGSVLSGPAMTVSGATVSLTGSVADADASLLQEGAEAVFELPDGGEHPARIVSLDRGSGSSGRWTVVLEPAPLSPEQMQQVQGSNVRVQIPVGATDGEVLSVPYAALTAGPGGESRVEVVVGDPRDGPRAETRLVVVETGLAAGGYVEVTPVEGELSEGDLVVVGS